MDVWNINKPQWNRKFTFLPVYSRKENILVSTLQEYLQYFNAKCEKQTDVCALLFTWLAGA